MTSVAGAVLCGGRSSRMGADKSLIAVDDVPMAARVAAALSAGGCHPVVAVGGDATALADIGLTVLPDGHPGEGPLGGVLTALHTLDGDGVLVTACDLPRLDPATVDALVAAFLATDDDVVVAWTGREEPLCAVWRTSTCIAVLEAAFVAGERSVHRAWEGLRRVLVPVERVALRNVNGPSDLEAL